MEMLSSLQSCEGTHRLCKQGEIVCQGLLNWWNDRRSRNLMNWLISHTITARF